MHPFLHSSLAIALGTAAALPVAAQGANNTSPPVEVSGAIRHDASPPLWSIANPPRSDVPRELPLRHIPHGQSISGQTDTALQTTSGPLISTSSGLGFAGVGNGDYGFVPNAAPPDTNGAVGATQYVQWVNESYAVFDKATGALVSGPIAGNSVWSGFGGGCETNNDGDPIVQYDKQANRWILTQFSVSTKPYLQCVAVSTTPDATGTYNRYAFTYGNTQFPDYPKLGVWPDGYYITYNIFNNGTTFAGTKVCAFDRSSMLTGAAATQQCFQLSTSYGGLLPSDLDGTTQPPTGSPNFLLNFGSNSLNLWKFHVDWTAPANTTLTGPINISVLPFSLACNGGTCIPQKNTKQKLDSLGDRLMYRLAYRAFNQTDGTLDHESLVVNHSVAATVNGTNTVGVRWYELQNPAGSTMMGGTPIVHQQGTFAPDATYRWMGSIAMDKQGNMALGYSASSSSTYPAIRYTVRASTDAPNKMQTEGTIKVGGGSQSAFYYKLSRWGDYSSMTVDPVDDCTFWYTTEYEKSTGIFNWSTWISSFKFPGCQ